MILCHRFPALVRRGAERTSTLIGWLPPTRSNVPLCQHLFFFFLFRILVAFRRLIADFIEEQRFRRESRNLQMR